MSANPNTSITLQQLRTMNGEDGERMWVAYQGLVYDVSDCPKWRRGLHEGQHFPGQDLTVELGQDAPHGAEVFNHPCVRLVGCLES